MIRLQDLTPEVYYMQSRDFQFIGRLYDVVLNSVKTNAETLYDLPLIDDARLLDLLLMTLGFKAKHEYSTVQLKAICKILPIILKYKGTLKALQLACDALVSSEGLNTKATIIEGTTVDGTTTIDGLVSIYLPIGLSDTTLLKDLLDYILPAGCNCNIVQMLIEDIDVYTNTTAGVSSIKKSEDNDSSGKMKSVLRRGDESTGDDPKIGYLENTMILREGH